MNMKSKIILIVDDTPENIQLISGILKSDYKVKAATSGEKALKIVQKSPLPDLIILDVMMPGMDGYQVCQALKTDPVTSDIPVLFITGNLSDEEKQKGLEMGAVAYFGKPVEPTLLLAEVKNILDE